MLFLCDLDHSSSFMSEWFINFGVSFTEEYSAEARHLPALTGLDRKQWALLRKQYFQDGINKDSLALVEKAMFHVSVSFHCTIVNYFEYIIEKQQALLI